MSRNWTSEYFTWKYNKYNNIDIDDSTLQPVTHLNHNLKSQGPMRSVGTCYCILHTWLLNINLKEVLPRVTIIYIQKNANGFIELSKEPMIDWTFFCRLY